MKKRIIIFGATGNIGVYLTDYLAEKFPAEEYEIIAVGRRKTSFFEKKGIAYVRLDIADEMAYDNLPQENIYAAIHLANLLPARMTDDNPYEYFDINVKGSINILEYLKKVDANRIIFTQTYADIAGHWGKSKILKHDLPRKLKYTGDHALYAISKCTVEDIISYYHETFGLGKFILRLPNIYMYAPEDYYYVDGQKTLVSYRYLIRRAIEGKPIEIWGNPDRERDMVYIKDFCQLVYKCLITDRKNGHYNVGTGVGTSLKEQIEKIIDVFSSEDKKSEIIYRPDKKDAMEYIMDISNAKEEIGYKPEYYYDDYLRDYKEEMNNNRFVGL